MLSKSIILPLYFLLLTLSGCSVYYTSEESDIDSCSLLTESEIEKTLGVKAEQVRASGLGDDKSIQYKQARCAYNVTLNESGGYHFSGMYVEVDSAVKFEEYKLHFVKVKDPANKDSEKTVKSKTIPINGVGKEAVWIPLQDSDFDDSYIAFVKNDHAVKIEVPVIKSGLDRQEAARKLAILASDRIP